MFISLYEACLVQAFFVAVHELLQPICSQAHLLKTRGAWLDHLAPIAAFLAVTDEL